MGSTLVAHILYAGNQIDIDLDNFFSVEGNAHAHAIGKINNTSLVQMHMGEDLLSSQYTCLIGFNSDNFYELLRIKFAYSKWYKQTPTVDNYTTFFNYCTNHDLKLWNNFYDAIRDTSWPKCNSIDDVKFLPDSIQREIIESYNAPKSDITTDSELLQFLTITYYDMFCIKYAPKCKYRYNMSEYLNMDIAEIPRIVKQYLGWDFNKERSEYFYKYVMKSNDSYTLWFNKIIKIYNDITTIGYATVSSMDVWEKAIIIAKIHEQNNLHPSDIDWNYVNFKKIITLEEINYGKTI